MMNSKPTKIYVEASSITEDRPSGVAHMVVALVNELSRDKGFNSKYKLVLLVPRDRKSSLNRWGFPKKTVKVKSIWLEKHILQILLKRNLLPPMDILIGKGIYIFPNYKTWPLLFSKSITFIYDVAFAIYPETVQPKNLAMLKRSVPIWINRADRIVTVSKSSKEDIMLYFQVPDEKISVVYCAVDINKYHQHSVTSVNHVRIKYKIPSKYLLFVGNIEPRKNIAMLLDAYSSLPDKLSKEYALVLIGGDGWLNEGIFEKINVLKRSNFNIIHPTVYVDDNELSYIYAGASLLIHPAIHEGFGMPILEAMASNIPVVTSNLSAMPEVAKDAALYFNPLKERSIRDTIERVLLDKELSKELISNGKKVAREFSWSNSSEDLIKCIASLSDE